MSLINCKVLGDNISYEDYSRQPDGVKRGDAGYIMSRSELVSFALCPAKWIAGADIDDDDTKATEWGKMVECLAMSPEDFNAKFAISPKMYQPAKGDEKPWDYRSPVCQEWREKRREDGFTVVSNSELTEAKLAIAQLKKNPTAMTLIECSRKQVYVAGFWKFKDSDIEIPVRALLDLVPNKNHPLMGKWLADFKTARNGDPEKWARVCEDSSYDVQAALHGDLYRAATGEDKTDWAFILQENTEPYHVVDPLPALSVEFLEYGRRKYHNALRLYVECLKTGKWPSYSTGDRLVIFGCQVIGPEELWSYKKTAGQGDFASRVEYAIEQPKETNPDLIP